MVGPRPDSEDLFDDNAKNNVMASFGEVNCFYTTIKIAKIMGCFHEEHPMFWLAEGVKNFVGALR
jgi:hypothetical protein